MTEIPKDVREQLERERTAAISASLEDDGLGAGPQMRLWINPSIGYIERLPHPTPGQLPYDLQGTVAVPERVRSRLDWIASVFTQLTGMRLEVSSGYRDAHRQAAAMVDKYEASSLDALLSLYHDDDGVREIVAAVEATRQSGGDLEARIEAAERVITARFERGAPISLHMIESALDISYKNLREPDTRLLKAIIEQIPGSWVKLEGDPPHLHMQFNTDLPFSSAAIMEVGFQLPVQELLSTDPYLQAMDTARDLSITFAGLPFRATWEMELNGELVRNERLFLGGALTRDQLFRGFVRLLAPVDETTRDGSRFRQLFNKGLKDAASLRQSLAQETARTQELRRREDTERSRSELMEQQLEQSNLAAEQARLRYEAAERQAAASRAEEARAAREAANRERAEHERLAQAAAEARRAREEQREREAQAQSQREDAERRKKDAERKAREEEQKSRSRWGLACVTPYSDEEDLISQYFAILRELLKDKPLPLLEFEDGREPLNSSRIIEQIRELLGGPQEPNPLALTDADTNQEYIRQITEYLRNTQRGHSEDDSQPSCGTPPRMRSMVTDFMERSGGISRRE